MYCHVTNALAWLWEWVIASFHWPEHATAFHKASLVPNHWAIPWHYDIVSSLKCLDSLLCVVLKRRSPSPDVDIIVSQGIREFFLILSSWKPAHNLALEIGAYSPGDFKYWFKNLSFDDGEHGAGEACQQSGIQAPLYLTTNSSHNFPVLLCATTARSLQSWQLQSQSQDSLIALKYMEPSA